MSTQTPPGWYPAPGDPPDTQRYWDGQRWIGGPQPLPPDLGAGDQLPIDHRLASAGSRIVARLLDGFIVAIPLLVLIFSTTDTETDTTPDTGVVLGSIVISAIYEIGFVAVKGATLGKLAMGLRIVDHDGRTPPSLAVASRRWLPNAVGAVPVVGSLAGLIVTILSLVWVLTDDRRRSVFDRVGLTYVVRVR